MKKFGANVGAALAGRAVASGHPVPVADTQKAVYPVAICMVAPGDGARRRLTMDATTPQRGEIWFAKLDAQSAFLVDEARFVRELRIHRVRLQPFKLDQHGKVLAPGSVTMVVPCKWQCPSCGKSKEHVSLSQLKRIQGTSTPICVDCKVKLERKPVPVKRVDVTDPSQLAMAKHMYAMFKAGPQDGETPNMAPRVWASFRVEDAPPATAWQPEANDAEAFRLDSILRDRYAAFARIHGEVKLIEPRGTAKGSGHRVWIAPMDCNMAAAMSPVAGKITSVEPHDGTASVVVAPSEEGAEPQTVVIENAPAMVLPEANTPVAFGAPLAVPKTWVPHEVEGIATVVINEGDIVEDNERIAEGFTVRPVKVPMDLDMGGIKAVFMSATQTADGALAPRYGWMTWEALTGDASADLGYTFYAAKDRAKPRDPRRDGVARMASV